MGRRLRIGIFLDSYYPEIDGVVMAADSLACALAEFCDVTMIIPDMGGKEEYKRPYDMIRVKSVIPVPTTNYKIGILRKGSKEYREILHKRFDVIHVQSPFVLGKAGVRIAKERNIPVFATVHSWYSSEVKKSAKSDWLTGIIMKYIISVYNACDRCIVVNDPLIAYIKKWGYRYEPVVIYNATDLTPPKDMEKSLKRVNECYGLSEDDRVLIYVGRISSTKNIYFLLDSLKLLKEDNVKYKMLYVGSGPDDQKLQSLIREYGLEDCVQMTGRVSDRELLSSIYARADLLVFPSVLEAFGLVKIEAAVNGTPGLYIRNSNPATDIQDNVNGFLAPQDKVKYKDRIKEILRDRERLTEVSENAGKTLSENWRTIARQHYHEYVKTIVSIHECRGGAMNNNKQLL